MLDTIGVEGRRAPLDAVDNIPFLQEQFGQICAVLTCYAGYQRNFAVMSYSGIHDHPPTLVLQLFRKVDVAPPGAVRLAKQFLARQFEWPLISKAPIQ
jgi:hypothetical protein